MVYVDSLAPCQTTAKWRYKYSCHMFADTSLELDDMAERMGLRPEWKQNPFTPTEHYDLTRNMRLLAVGYGAKPITRREAAELTRRKANAETRT